MTRNPSRLSSGALIEKLAAGKIVPLVSGNWNDLAEEFKIVEEISTGLAGSILLIRRPLPGKGKRQGWAIVEEPKPEERVIRPLKNEKEARALIADRLAAYERMWDG